MTEQEHAEISRRLALAIGWEPDQIYDDGDGSFCSVRVPSDLFTELWRDFDYRDPAVIWPIAERFDCFPWKALGSWWAATQHSRHEANTAALAVARAVIAAKEKA